MFGVALGGVVALTAACVHHERPTTSTTTVTSGEPSGVRVTNVRTQTQAYPEAGLVLADELCRRESACNQIGPGGTHRTEEACMVDLGTRAPALLASWRCSPAAARARFEECLAQIRSERCETDLSSGVSELPQCRPNVMCPGNERP